MKTWNPSTNDRFHLQLHGMEKILLIKFGKKFKKCVRDPDGEWRRRGRKTPAQWKPPLQELFKVVKPSSLKSLKDEPTKASLHKRKKLKAKPCGAGSLIVTCMWPTVANSKKKIPPTKLSIPFGKNLLATAAGRHVQDRLDILELFMAHEFEGRFEKFLVSNLLKTYWKCCGALIRPKQLHENYTQQLEEKHYQWRNAEPVTPIKHVCVRNFSPYSRLCWIRKFLIKEWGKKFDKAIVDQELVSACKTFRLCAEWLHSVNPSFVPSGGEVAAMLPAPCLKQHKRRRRRKAKNVVAESAEEEAGGGSDATQPVTTPGSPQTPFETSPGSTTAAQRSKKRTMATENVLEMDIGLPGNVPSTGQESSGSPHGTSMSSTTAGFQVASGMLTSSQGKEEEDDENVPFVIPIVSSLTTAERSLEPNNMLATDVATSSPITPDTDGDTITPLVGPITDVSEPDATPTLCFGGGAAADLHSETKQLNGQETIQDPHSSAEVGASDSASAATCPTPQSTNKATSSKQPCQLEHQQLITDNNVDDVPQILKRKGGRPPKDRSSTVAQQLPSKPVLRASRSNVKAVNASSNRSNTSSTQMPDEVQSAQENLTSRLRKRIKPSAPTEAESAEETTVQSTSGNTADAPVSQKKEFKTLHVECEICGKSVSKNHLSKHKQSKGCNPSQEENPNNICDICGKSVCNSYYLKTHRMKCASAMDKAAEKTRPKPQQ